MCNNLTTIMGEEIWSVGGMRALGFPISESIKDDSCLCSVDMEELLPQDKYKTGHFESYELDDQGRTYHERWQKMSEQIVEGREEIVYSLPEYVDNPEKWFTVSYWSVGEKNDI